MLFIFLLELMYIIIYNSYKFNSESYPILSNRNWSMVSVECYDEIFHGNTERSVMLNVREKIEWIWKMNKCCFSTKPVSP